MSEQYGGQWNQPAGGNPQPEHLPYGSPQPQPGGYGAPPTQPYGQPAQPGYAQQWSGGLPQPPYASGYPMAPVMPLRGDYAPWARRVGAYLIDGAPSLVGSIIFYIGYIPFIIAMVSSGTATPDFSTGLIPMLIGGIIMFAALGWQIYNRWFIAGRTGQSLGKRVTKIRLISEETNGPIGPLNAFLRDLVHTVDGFAYVGYLWPLWDDKRQTFSDKLMKTIVVYAPQSQPPIAPFDAGQATAQPQR